MYLKLVNAMAKNFREAPYITDGLLLFLDGENPGNTSGVWETVVGNMAYTLGANVRRGEKCFIFGGTGLASSPLSFNVANTYTVELVIEQTNSNPTTQYIFCGGAGKNLNMVLYNSTSIMGFRSSREKYSVPNALNNRMTIAYNGSYCYVNKESRGAAGVDQWGNDYTNSSIGGDPLATSRMFQGKIYAVRIYNRTLTYDEIMHNQESDIQRYGITI